MVKRIDELTTEQRAAMPGHAAHWIEVGQRTGPVTDAEWRQWEEAVARCYGFAGLDWHGTVIRVDSPLAGAIVAPLISVFKDNTKTFPSARVVADLVVEEDIPRQVMEYVEPLADSLLRKGLPGPFGRTGHDRVVADAVVQAARVAYGDAVSEAGLADISVLDHVLRLLERSEVAKVVRDQWWRYLGGQYNAPWFAWTSFFRDVCDLELDGDLWDRARAYEATSVAGWWWPWSDYVVVCDRPVTLSMENPEPNIWRMHDADRPAIAWSDGWSLFCWHGVRVPEWVITQPGDVVKRITEEQNAEVRRAAIEKMGWDQFTTRAELEIVATADDPGNPGQQIALYSVPEELWGEDVRVAVVVNGSPERDGTRRRYGLTVPADIDDPVAAMAWTYGLEPTQYAAMERRT